MHVLQVPYEHRHQVRIRSATASLRENLVLFRDKNSELMVNKQHARNAPFELFIRHTFASAYAPHLYKECPRRWTPAIRWPSNRTWAKEKVKYVQRAT
jgi:hypothetical protein